MAVSSDFQNVQQIAACCCCDEIDTRWFSSLATDPTAVQTCEERLNRLVTITVRCCALDFPTVRFYRERKEPIQTRLFLTANKQYVESLKTYYNQAAQIFPIEEEEATFFLLYNRKISYVELFSESENIFHLEAPKGHILWNVSASKIEAMTQKSWNRTFVTASQSWNYVIPLPSTKQVDHPNKKTRL